MSTGCRYVHKHECIHVNTDVYIHTHRMMPTHTHTLTCSCLRTHTHRLRWRMGTGRPIGMKYVQFLICSSARYGCMYVYSYLSCKHVFGYMYVHEAVSHTAQNVCTSPAKCTHACIHVCMRILCVQDTPCKE